MIFCVLVLVLSSVPLSRQHLSYPINFCSMAATCIHDGRGVCASSPDGCSRRSFLDQCDMYEYNCDYGTRYQETYILFCSWMQTRMFQISTKNSINTVFHKTNTTNILVKNATVFQNILLTLKYNAAKTTKAVFKIHETSSKSTRLTNDAIEISTLPCCGRSKTWQTTTDKMIEKLETPPFSSTLNENKISKTAVPANLEYSTTESNTRDNNNLIKLLTSTVNNVTVAESTSQFTDLFFAKSNPESSTILLFANNESVTANNSRNSVLHYCCNRPVTWETTTEITKIVEYKPFQEMLSSHENKIPEIHSTRSKEVLELEVQTIPRYISTKTNDTKEVPFIPLRLTSKIPSDQTNSPKIVEIINVENNLTNPSEIVNEIPTKKYVTKNQMKCKFRCQRPLTWLTTTRKRRTVFHNY